MASCLNALFVRVNYREGWAGRARGGRARVWQERGCRRLSLPVADSTLTSSPAPWLWWGAEDEGGAPMGEGKRGVSHGSEGREHLCLAPTEIFVAVMILRDLLSCWSIGRRLAAVMFPSVVKGSLLLRGGGGVHNMLTSLILVGDT